MRGIAADLHRAAAGDKVSKAVSTAAKATGHDAADELTALGLTRTPSVDAIRDDTRVSLPYGGTQGGGGETPAP